ncbi:MAG TPA: 3-deoxy-7-phosphoheptulonate synthase [Chloroflexota bacterium]
MIVVMRAGAPEEAIEGVVRRVAELGFRAHLSRGEERTIVGVIGDERPIDPEHFEVLDGVERVVRILQPFKLASRDFKPEPTEVDLGGVTFGGAAVAVIAGPCSVESREQVMETAQAVKEAGAHALRGGAFKPRSSPYSFQGLGAEGLELLAEAGERVGLPVVTEVMAPGDVDAVARKSAMLQIGTRNMANYALLHEVGRSGKPVLLKRGMSSTIQELLMAAEYILSNRNYNLVLCERGIRTFEPATRFTLDINAVGVLAELTHLPVIVDPSHATGKASLVAAASRAAIAAGADGLIVEVHPHPERALSDGAQSLRPEQFAQLMREVRDVAHAVGRTMHGEPA